VEGKNKFDTEEWEGDRDGDDGVIYSNPSLPDSFSVQNATKKLWQPEFWCFRTQICALKMNKKEFYNYK